MHPAIILLLAWLIAAPDAGLAQGQADTLQRHNDAAQTFQLGGDLPGAEAENRAVAGIVLQRLGNLKLREHKYAEAEELLAQSLRLYPASDARFDLANLRLYQSKAAEGIAEAQAGLKQDDKNARGHHILGKLYYLKGDYKAAVAELERSVVLQPSLDVGYALALAYLNVKDLTKARLIFDEMILAFGNTAAMHMVFGRAYQGTGFAELALPEFKKAIALDPRVQRAHFHIGFLLGQQAMLQEASQEFEAELKIDDDFLSHYYLGYIELQGHEYVRAKAHLQHAALLDPDTIEPPLYLAQVYSETGEAALAVLTLKRAIKLAQGPLKDHPEVNRAHYMLGRLLIKSGQQEEGEKEIETSHLSKETSLSAGLGKKLPDVHAKLAKAGADTQGRASEATPDQPDLIITPKIDEESLPKDIKRYLTSLAFTLGNALNNLGVIYAQKQQFATAADFFRQSAAWTPDLKGLDRNWGMAAFAAGSYGDAIPPLERHVSQHASELRPRRILALSYFMQEKYASVVSTLVPLRDTLPPDPALLSAYAESLSKVGDFTAAERLLSRLAQENPKSAEVRLLLGQHYAGQDKFVPALQQYDQALALDSALPQIHYYKGQVLLRQGKPAAAADEFRAELQISPADTAAKYHLAYVLLQQEKKDDAVALLREVIRAKPDYAEAHYELGKTLLEKNEVSAAVENLEAAARLSPEGSYNHYQLSMAYRRAGRPADAERELGVYRKLKETARGRSRDPQP